MSRPYQVLYKDGEWQINEQELFNILEDSGLDSGDDVLLDANIVQLEENDDNCSSDGSSIAHQDAPISQTVSAENAKQIKVWYPGKFTEKVLPEDNQSTTPPQRIVKSPLQYFSEYFPEQHFVDAATNSNIYHLKVRGTELKTSAYEIKKLYGIFLMMGCIQFPRLEMYWRRDFRLDIVANAIKKTRFKTLRSSLHYVDINQTAADPTNLFWKLKPLINTVRDRCRALPRNITAYSVDEQMIPYTGRCPARQYVKNKPRPVGLKNFVVATAKGLVMDFEIYQGENTNLADRSLGLGPAVVIRLVETVPKGSHIFFDRYFTTVPLLYKLLELGYFATGTIMSNRLKNITFKLDRHMQRGESQEFIQNDGTHELTVVKWKDTKCVTALSSASGTNPPTSVNRWNKPSKSYINIPCPNIIASYNKNMGGVDIVDQMLEYYRTYIKTKKWTLKATNHFIDLAVVNAWLEYREDVLACGVPKKQRMDLLQFKLEVASALLSTAKRGRRDSSSEEENEAFEPSPQRLCSPLPCIGKRYDGYEHWPIVDFLNTARNCRLETCKSRTRNRCEKCNVYLCLTSTKNCFKHFHMLKK